MIQQVSIHIVEDEMIIATDLQDMLEELGYHIDGISMSFNGALDHFKQSRPDLVLLDIILAGEKTGIDLAHELNQLNIPFIFLTSHSDKHSVDLAKKTKPAGYLIKPFDKDEVFAAVEIGMARLGTPPKTEQSLFIPKGKGRVKIPLDDILFAEASGNYIIIHTVSEQFILRKTLKEAESSLLVNRCFVRVHKSFIVNRHAVKKISSSEITLHNGTLLPVGRTFSDEIKKL